MPYCTECGGKLMYDRSVKQYACQSCGATFTSQELLESRQKVFQSRSKGDDEARKQREYLEWWLSDKKKRKP
ncbi:MAG: hypothetical protein ACETV0_08460 [Nitrososphaeria archaeon]